MKRKWFTFSMIVLVLVVAGCGGQQKAETTPATTSIETPATPQAPSVEQTQQTAVVEEAEPSQEQPAAALTAETLVGTKWQAGPYKLEFQANGVLVLNDSQQGTWSVEGNSVKVSAGNNSYTAEIRGDKLFYGGMPLTRLN